MPNRRGFIRTATVLAGAVASGAAARAERRGDAQPASSGAGSTRLLVLGGTGFIGPHLVRHAASRGPWVMLKGNDLGHQSVKNDKVVASGLGFRPLEQTLADTLAWWPSVPEARRAAPRFAVSGEAETKALAAWKARK